MSCWDWPGTRDVDDRTMRLDVVVALAAKELKLEVTNRVAWFAYIVFLGIAYRELRGWAPVLERVSLVTAVASLVLAAVILMSGVRVARRLRNDERGLLPGSPLNDLTRFVGAVSAIVGVCLLWLILAVIPLGWALASRPGGAVVWSEIGLAVSIWFVAGSFGLLVGNRTVSGLAGPMTVLVLAAVNLVLTSRILSELLMRYTAAQATADTANRFTFLLAPFPPYDTSVAYLLQTRGGWHHVVYVSLVGALVLSLYWRAQATHVGRSSRLMPLVVTGIAMVSVGTTQPFHDDDLAREALKARVENTTRECIDVSWIVACLYPEYLTWSTDYERAVRSLADIPPSDHSSDFRLVQYETFLHGGADAAYGLVDLPQHQDEIQLNTWWARSPPVNRETYYSSFHLSLAVSARLIGFPATLDNEGEFCQTGGQARAVVALWMAVQEEMHRQYLLNQVQNPFYFPLFSDDLTEGQSDFLDYSVPESGEPMLLDRGLNNPLETPWFAMEFNLREAYLALQLRNLPKDSVAEEIRRSWVYWTDAATTTSDLAQHFDLHDPRVPYTTPTGANDRSRLPGEPCE